ncbi:hypothetical protein HYS72_02065 [Candidatus Pacearchaeota archaeon]|nr:hypothetical protein [Candidatus Pacearchaeota archaeon]
MHVKYKALDLIEKYNLSGKRRIVIPRNDFGELFFNGQYFFIAHYFLDSGKRKIIGFKQRGEDFFEYNSKERKRLNVVLIY